MHLPKAVSGARYGNASEAYTHPVFFVRSQREGALHRREQTYSSLRGRYKYSLSTHYQTKNRCLSICLLASSPVALLLTKGNAKHRISDTTFCLKSLTASSCHGELIVSKIPTAPVKRRYLRKVRSLRFPMCSARLRPKQTRHVHRDIRSCTNTIFQGPTQSKTVRA